jgi:hypothetical protein
MVRTLSGSTVAGYDNGNVSGAAFSAPAAFAYDAQGVLYIADRNNYAIRRITPTGMVTTVAGLYGVIAYRDGPGNDAAFGQVNGITVTSAGTEIYVTDTTYNRIRRIRLAPDSDPGQAHNWHVTTIAGGGSPNVGEYVNGFGKHTRFNKPWGIVLTSGGDLLISEAEGNRIRRARPTAEDLDLKPHWQVTLVAGEDATVSPTGDSTNGAGSVARFNAPKGITLAASGEIYVADSGSHQIRKVSHGDVTTVAGAAVGYGDNDLGLSASFNNPTDVAVDRSGYIYVADAGNFLIRRISPAGAVRTVAGFGAAGTADGAGNVARFSSLNGLELTSAGDVIVGDANRIRLIQRLISNGN